MLDPDQITILKRFDLEEYLRDKYSIVFNSFQQASCPFHPDTKLSFRIRIADGTWDWYCQECNRRGCIIDFLMEWEQIDVAEAIRKLEIELPFTLQDIYDGWFTAFRRVYFDPKSAKYWRPRGHEEWIGNIRIIADLPYELDKFINDHFVVIVDREMDADTITEKLGWAATTSLVDIGNWWEYLRKYFKDKEVVIIPSNDEVSKEHAQKVADSLQKDAISIKILDLPELRMHETISHWLEKQSSSRDYLEELLRKTPQYRLGDKVKK